MFAGAVHPLHYHGESSKCSDGPTISSAKEQSMRVICGCLMLAISVALINLAWASQGGDKKDKDKVQPKPKVYELAKVTANELTINSELNDDDGAYADKMHAKFYDVKFDKGKTYTIQLMGKGTFNPYLFLEDDKKKVLAQDDNSGGGFKNLDAKIVFKAPDDGVYRVVVTSSMGLGKGAFRLVIEEQAGKDGDKKPKEQPKVRPREIKPVSRVQLTIDSELTDKDGGYGDKAHAKIYEVKFSKDKTYHINLIASKGQFDPYLYLEDAKSKLLAEDDDAGGVLNSLIVFKAPADAVYRVIATALDEGWGGTGSFRLYIEEK